MKPHYDAVWFDLDGTLMDTATDLISAIITTVEAAGENVQSEAAIRERISDGGRYMLAAAMGVEVNDAKVENLLPDFINYYEKNTCAHSDYFAGIEEILSALEASNTPWGIVTNKHERLSKNIVIQKHLQHRIAALVCGDTLPRAKPHPDPLLFACAHINVAPEKCLFLGDSKNDIDAATAAKMDSVACGWGYIAEKENPTLWQATYFINHPSELNTIIWSKK